MATDTLVSKGRLAQILLVEDNEGDVVLTKRAFAESKIANNLSVAKNGEEAISRLRKEGEYANTETPDIILLDLNLPKMSGQEVLQVIKNDERLRYIPIIILSSSRAEQDVVKSYDLHANGYIVKPVNMNDLSQVVSKLEAFWFTLVVMPDSSDIKQAS